MTDESSELGPARLLEELAAQGIAVSLKGDDLNVRAPKGVFSPEIRSLLATHKEGIVALLRQRDESFPMTDIQKAYWMGRQGLFALNCAIRTYSELDGDDLDIERLDAAWAKVVARHEMLRVESRPNFTQRIRPADQCAYHLEVIDLRNEPAERREHQLLELRTKQLAHTFKPEEWPPFRIVVARIDEKKTRLVFDVDLMSVDGGSVSIVLNDWLRFYSRPDEPPPPLHYSYREYATTTQSDHHEGSEVFQRALGYWREYVRTLPAAPQLPTIRQPGSVRDSVFGRKQAKLDAARWSRLKAVAARRNITPTCAVLAAFQEVLGAWSASRRFTLNVTLLNRLPVHPQVGEVVGDFTSILLLGIDGETGPLLERFTRIQDTLLAHMDHAAVSGVRVLQEYAQFSGVHDGAAFPIVFTSFINGQMDGIANLKKLGNAVYAVTNTPQVTLDHQVYEADGGLDLNWDFVEGIFPEGMLDAMLASYRSLLEQLADDERLWEADRPELAPKSELAARARVNETARPLAAKCLHQLFLDRVPSRGSHPAVVCGARSLGYDELERASGQAARWLRDGGARPGELVAVVMEKGWEQVVGSLAALRAGAAYLPIDPSLPPERVRWLLEDGDVRLAVTQTRVDGSVAWPEGVRRLAVDAPLDEGTQERLRGVPIDASGGLENLAYVLYTSGSTGTPKGVMIEHRNAANTVLAVNELYGVGPDDRVLALSSLSFDLSVYDLWGTLAAGGTVVMPEAGSWRDPAYLADLMVRERVSVWNSVPALMEIFIEHVAKRSGSLPDALRLVFFSGDRIPTSLPPRVREVLPRARVISLGGPTETSIWSVTHPDIDSRPWCDSIPYGRPLPNQTIDVLDETLAPCPVWVAGEIYIGGQGVGRGYWKNRERTEAAFLEHPRTGERIYKSGDRGRWLPDGTIEILGRTDFQVKIRGFRIELGEIEAVLNEHPAVTEAVVTVSGASAAEERLVAHVVAAHGDGPAPAMKADDIAFKLARHGVRKNLSKAVALDTRSDEHLAQRRSVRRFRREAVSIEALGCLLSALRCVRVDDAPLPKYRYPSGGSTYGVQTYVYARAGRVAGLEEGIYYHHPETHELQLVAKGTMDSSVHVPVNQQIFDASAFTIFFVGQASAVKPLYGELTDEFMLLEAGYMGQLLMGEAAACDLGLCPIGAVHFEKIAAMFALDEGQRYVHAMLGGGALPASEEARAPSVASPDAKRTLVEELRTMLRAKLPEYMVPTAIAVLDRLPLSANGKIDRKLLVAPVESGERAARSDYVAPIGERQKRLSDLVCEVLNLPRISVHDNFFELGATSVKLVQLHGRLGEISPRKLQVVDVFKYPTVATLAQRLGDESDEGENLERGRSRAELRKRRFSRDQE